MVEIQEKVEEIRRGILKRSIILSENLNQLMSDDNKNDEYFRIASREILGIISDLSLLSDYCDKKSKEKIRVFKEVGTQFSIISTPGEIWERRIVIKYWAANTNTIEMNYDKYPFSISAGLQANFKIFKPYIHAQYNRLGFPGGSLGAIISIIILVVIAIFIVWKCPQL